MSASTPYTISGALNYPPDAGAAAVDRTFGGSGNFESKTEATYVLTGAGTQSVDFGTITTNGAKAVLVELDADPSPSAAPVNVQFNGGGAPGQLEISPGGHFDYHNPVPTAGGVLSMDIVHTTNACVRVRVLG